MSYYHILQSRPTFPNISYAGANREEVNNHGESGTGNESSEILTLEGQSVTGKHLLFSRGE